MQATHYDATRYRGSGPENYEKFFVPAIGAPLAKELVAVAALAPGERVLDVACGTGLVTRLAAQQVGEQGSVAGLDVNPCMLAVARTLGDARIEWYETGAEAIPLPDASFDVVLCQMGLQFFSGKQQAVNELRRVLRPGGRLVLNVPGPTPPLFKEMADALAAHIDPQAASFVHAVFSLHDAGELRQLLSGAGFADIDVSKAERALDLPAPREFLWQYIHSTPLAATVMNATEAQRTALENDVVQRWQRYERSGTLALVVTMTTVVGR